MALTPLTEHLAANLRRLRRERDLSQRQIATIARVTQAYVSMLEYGLRPARLDHVEGLAKALAVPMAELLAPPSSRAGVKGTKKVRLKLS